MIGRLQSLRRNEPAEETKSFYWRHHGMVALQIDDARLSWELKALLKIHMTKHYGNRNGACDEG